MISNIKIYKDSKKEAKRAWQRVDSFESKSKIYPRFNFKTFKIQWIFKYRLNSNIDNKNVDKIKRLVSVADSWEIMIKNLRDK